MPQRRSSLSVALQVSVANQAGYEAQHIARVGKAGWKDWHVVNHATSGNFVLVTNNASDFPRLYAREALHAGLVIIIPTVGRTVQQQLFRGALDEIATLGELINRVLEVELEGDEAVFATYDLPA